MKQALVAALLAPLLFAGEALADAQTSRFAAGGYYRIMTRPDFQGGDSRLGLWNLGGRLLNEGPYGMLQLQLNVLQSDLARNEPWALVNARIEGGSFANADSGRGGLANFRVSGLFVQAGNILLDHVTWQLGTLDFYPGDLGLYDLRPANLFNDTVGLSALWRTDGLEVLVAAGDSGYGLRGTQYDTVFTSGAWVKARLGGQAELGVGGQLGLEPQVVGNRLAPYATPGIDYADFVRGEVVKHYFEQNPHDDRIPLPEARASSSWKLVGYLGFGKLGPLRWSSLYAHLARKHPDNFSSETYNGKGYTLYVHDLTDQRYEAQVGNEMQLTVIPGVLDAAWGVLYGRELNQRNTIAAGEDNRSYLSTVLRLQAYATDTVHFLVESSVSQERSLNGNLYREHVDSVFRSSDGLSNPRGLQFGDADVRNTWQGKAGLVFNPAGRGIYNRPSLRLLYGLQYSNAQAAFANTFSSSLSQDQEFPQPSEKHWHSVIALEAEGWF